MAQLYAIDPVDVATLDELRATLKQRRLDMGLLLKDAGVLAGRHPEFMSMLERGVHASPRLASLQMWAAALDARIEFGLEGFWDVEHDDSEMLWLDKLRDPWGADEHMRLWLVAALRAWRVAHGVDVGVVSQGLGIDRDGARRWEWETTDPLVGRVMVTARLVGTRLLLPVVFKEDWPQTA